jgi:hypothetical protein
LSFRTKGIILNFGASVKNDRLSHFHEEDSIHFMVFGFAGAFWFRAAGQHSI